ncbi:MAG: hypothetical protein HYR85_04340 [Planctomycetes bacterium]|nr:hypothetical protein [Planctomycetota bacterium]
MKTPLLLAAAALLVSSADAIASSRATVVMPRGVINASIELIASRAADHAILDPGESFKVALTLENRSPEDVVLYVAPLNLRYISKGSRVQILLTQSLKRVKIAAGASAVLVYDGMVPADADRDSEFRVGTMIRDEKGAGTLLWAIGTVDSGLRPEIPERGMIRRRIPPAKSAGNILPEKADDPKMRLHK